MPAPLCAPKSEAYFFFAAFFAGFFATFFFAAFFLAAIVLAPVRRVFPWRFPGESLGFSAVLPRRKLVHGSVRTDEAQCIVTSKTARAIN